MTERTLPLSYFQKGSHVTAGYHAPNVTSHVNDDGTLLRVSNNDPSIASLYLQIDDDDAEDWHEINGRPISTCIHLRQLDIYSNSVSPANFLPFCKLISQNRSIEHFTICHLDLDANIGGEFPIFAPFFEHNHNLRSIEIVNCTIREVIHHLSDALFLSKTCRLERINLGNNELGDELAAGFVDALHANPGLNNLLDLCLDSNMIALDGCISLCKLLKHSSCKLECLNLQCNDIDDECISSLIGALTINNTVRYLDISGQELVTTQCWCTFTRFLSSSDCSVESLFLGDNNIGDAGITSLGESLSVNKTLKHLDLRSCYDITVAGWEGFSRLSFVGGIEVLDLSNCSIDDVGLVNIALSTKRNVRMKKLVLSNLSISSAGWSALFTIWLENGRPQLNEFDLSENGIDDEGVALLVDLVANHMTTLRLLNVYGNLDVTPEGWRSFIDVLQPSSTSKLKELNIGSLFLSETDVGDDIIIGFADVLATNTSLEQLDFYLGVSARGLNFIANAFCDKSSIENCYYNSNHTLYQINCSKGWPNNVWSLLGMNLNMNKSEVARRKILLYHLSDINSIGLVFGPMAETILPSAISWIGRDRVGLSAMFNLLRSKPSLIPKNASRGNKRKRKSETLCVINNHSSINRAV